MTVELAHVSYTLEEALQGTASRFFNTKVNVSNQEEWILTLLMAGLTFRHWKSHLKHGSLHGIPRDLTNRGTNQFEYRYGDANGLRDDPPVLSRCGEHIGIDAMYPELQVITYTDASLGTAPKGRSVVANLTKLNPDAGAVSASTKATTIVFTSSFEPELDGVTRGLKANSRIVNIMKELRQKLSELPRLWSDDEAVVNFVRGEGVAKGVRHMELRMWYVRERYKDGSVLIDWMEGEQVPSDKIPHP